MISNSGLFDPDWYAAEQDLKGGSNEALAHFQKLKGVYDPSVRFSSGAYLSDNADVREAALNPLLHYLCFGKDEGRVIKDIYGRISGVAEPLEDEATARLRDHFDEDFYRDANPDLHASEALFEHFMRVGWRQDRDPAPWFSVKGYLADHSDLIGKNPFVQYILSKDQNRTRVRRSRQTREAPAKPISRSELRLAAVAMIKNEADIVGLFTSHLLALFDDVVIVDHQSDDGTTEFLVALAERFPQVRLLTLCEPSYIQSTVMTHVVRDIPKVRCADWVFILDVDEFLPFETREAFLMALEEYRGCTIISMRWRNLVPAKYNSGVVDITTESEFFVPPAFSPFKKVAFQPARLTIDQVVVAQGNHALISEPTGVELRAFDAKFHLLHIPIRSAAQILLKLRQGVRSYQMLGSGRNPKQGTHWHRMKQEIKTQVLHDGHLNAMAVNYSQEGQSLDPISTETLMALGFKRQTVTFANKQTGLNVSQKRLRRANISTQFTAQDLPYAVRLMTCENGDLVSVKEQSPPNSTQAIQLTA